MLPRSRIPWPLPAEYGKNRRVNHAEDKQAKTKAWQRRISGKSYILLVSNGKGQICDPNLNMNNNRFHHKQ